MQIHNSKKLLDRRRELRSAQTPTEKLLWKALRGNQMGYKFKRQHSVGGYILDFFCPSKRFVIELDGEIHDQAGNKKYDQIRNKFFEDFGYTVLRFRNKEVENNLNNVIHIIKTKLESIPLSLPRRGAGGEVN